MVLDTLVHFLHILFAIVWVGGMVFMKIILMPALTAIDPIAASRVFGQVAKRFTIAAWSSTVALLVTGLLITPSGFLFETDTDYGVILLVKHVLFLVMIVVGVIITVVVVPKIRRLAPPPGEVPSGQFLATQKLLNTLSAVNMGMGLGVIFAISAI